MSGLVLGLVLGLGLELGLVLGLGYLEEGLVLGLVLGLGYLEEGLGKVQAHLGTMPRLNAKLFEFRHLRVVVVDFGVVSHQSDPVPLLNASLAQAQCCQFGFSNVLRLHRVSTPPIAVFVVFVRYLQQQEVHATFALCVRD